MCGTVIAPLAVFLFCAGAVSAQQTHFNCAPDTFPAYANKPDGTPFTFKRPMDNDDTEGYSQFFGSLNYDCNHDTGGAVLKQNLSFVFSPVAKPQLVIDSGHRHLQSDPNATLPTDGFALSGALGIEAHDCLGTEGVNITYDISVMYPTGVWRALSTFSGDNSGWISTLIKSTQLTNRQEVTGSVLLTEMKPEFKLSEIICPKKGGTCGADAKKNLTAALLTATGSDIKFSIESILGANGQHKKNSVLSLKEDVEFSLLSPLASTICSGFPEFCCAGPPDGTDSSAQITCCCTVDDTSPLCSAAGKPGVPGFTGYVADTCTAATGKNTRCGDAVKGKLITDPNAYESDCDAFKKAIYNFTKGYRQRVSLYPSSAAPSTTTLAATETLAEDTTTLLGDSKSDAGTKKFNLIQLFYAELCSLTLGYNKNKDSCPGCSQMTGTCTGQWITGSDKEMDTDEAVVTIGDVKSTSCNNSWTNFLRAVGKGGAAAIIVAILMVLVAGGFFGYRRYKKKQEELNYNVNINDDSIYKDVASSSEAETVVR